MVAITTVAPQPPISMPTDRELLKLVGIVYAQHPRLYMRDEAKNEKKHVRALRLAFFAVSTLGRLAEPETKNARSVFAWAEYATGILRDGNLRDDTISTQAFTTAVLMSGDIAHTVLPARWPVDCSFAVTYPSAGIPARDAWRDVLASGALRQASPTGYQHWDMGTAQTPSGGAGVQIGLVKSTVR